MVGWRWYGRAEEGSEGEEGLNEEIYEGYIVQ